MTGSPIDLDAELDALTSEPLTPRGFLANASNHTMLAQVGAPTDGRFAIYKPRSGERPLWDFPAGTLCQREVAAFEVARLLGWDVVPPTVLRDDAPMGPGSVQVFIPHDPERHYFTLLDEPAFAEPLARIAVFDFLVNNADRKAGHVLAADDGRLLGIDHGLCFHSHPKLRTVIWDLGGTEIPKAWRADIHRFADTLVDGDGADAALAELLAEEEIAALVDRARTLCDLSTLPDVPRSRRPYPWPPL